VSPAADATTRRGLTVALDTRPQTARTIPPVVVLPEAEQREGRRSRRWFGAARSARTRILASYVILLAFSAVLSTLAIREVLVIRVDDQVKDALQQEVLELDRLVADGRDPQTGRPFESPQALFDVYLARNVPSDDEALLTFVDGRLYRATLAQFPVDRLPAERLAQWETLSTRLTTEPESVSGRFNTELGTAHYRVARIRIGEAAGVFVVTILPATELSEIGELQRFGAAVTLLVLLIGSGFAWLVAGRVLAPVRLLTETARTISQSDLTRRIEVRGTGEATEMARTFNAMLDRLEGVFQSQREFVQDASHELRDPLTICRGHLELLGDDPEERLAAIALVMDELDRIGRIVDDLSVLAESEQPDFLQPKWIDLEAFTHDLAAKASALGSRQWKLDHADEGAFLADRDRLTEAVMNLAHNAVQHTVAHDSIAIGTSSNANEARIWVRDSGSGIAVEDQAKIFDRFKRGGDSHRRYRGGGLGLAIVKTVAEAHGGTVELESRLGEGSMFTIVLPIETDHRSSWWPGS
jgi:signal transduction histidine kinase